MAEGDHPAAAYPEPEDTDGGAGEAFYPLWTDVSPKQLELDRVLLGKTEGRPNQLLHALLGDEALHYGLGYANAVSIRRLGYNDHGPVHARIVTYNALKLLRLLGEGGVEPSLLQEEVGSYEDAQVALILAAYLHDLGMGVARKGHEWHSITLADPYIRRYLADLYPDGHPMQAVLRPLIYECIIGHMANEPVHSVEAGIVLVADGTDMAKGRSRIPQQLGRDPVVGDIHRYSASAVKRVELTTGHRKPVRIDVTMENMTGLFQVEQVLMQKVHASPIMPHVEISVNVADEPPRYYLQ